MITPQIQAQCVGFSYLMLSYLQPEFSSRNMVDSTKEGLAASVDMATNILR